jgi:replicative DNA helicase
VVAMTVHQPMSPTSQTELQSVVVEERLIATLLSYPEVFPHLADFLGAEDFSEPLFGRIFKAVTEAHARGEHWTVLTILPKFRGDPAVLELGKPSAYFARLAAIASLPASAFDDARMVVAFADLHEISVIAADLGDRISRSKLQPHFDAIIEALDRLSTYVNLACLQRCKGSAPEQSLTGTGAAAIGDVVLAARRAVR